MAFLEIRPDEIFPDYYRPRVAPKPRLVAKSAPKPKPPVEPFVWSLEKFEPFVWSPSEGESRPQQFTTIKRIVEVVAYEFCLTPADITAHRKTWQLVIPRHICMFLARKLTLHSYPLIAKKLRRDHSSVISGIENIEKRMAVSQSFADRVAEIEKRVMLPL